MVCVSSWFRRLYYGVGGCLIAISITCAPLIVSKASTQKHILIDGIVAAVYGPQKTDIITYSDLQRPGIDGSVRSFHGLINRALKDQDCQRYGMRSSPEAVVKNLQMIFRSNNWSEEDFNKMIMAAGWLPEEAREEFRIMTDVNQMEQFKILNQLIIPERDIEAYCQAHPEYEEARYLLQRVVVPNNLDMPRDEQREALSCDIRKNTLDVEWPEPFWISNADIAEDKAFIRSLPLNTISEPQETFGGFELLRVVEIKERRLKNLEERRNDIIDILRRPKAELLQSNYEKELRKNGVLVCFDEDIAREVQQKTDDKETSEDM